MHEVMEVIKQLKDSDQTAGVQTFFLTLSCADLKWNDMFYVIFKVNGINISEDEIIGMSYSDRYKLLKRNPVIVARHFQY